MPLQNNSNYKVIQISDTHLFKTNKFLDGVDTNNNFSKVIERVKSDELENCDAIFLTGDLSQDESSKSYEIIAELLKDLKIPVLWIPGNHDALEVMQEAFKVENFKNVKILDTCYWRFIFLNTKKDGIAQGFLNKEEINFLEHSIADCDSQKAIAVVMHHHPIEVGTPFIDNYMLINRDVFWKIVGEKIELIICGHVHGDYFVKFNNINVETGPATCVQWKKKALYRESEKRIGYKVYYFKDKSYVAEPKIWES